MVPEGKALLVETRSLANVFASTSCPVSEGRMTRAFSWCLTCRAQVLTVVHLRTSLIEFPAAVPVHHYPVISARKVVKVVDIPVANDLAFKGMIEYPLPQLCRRSYTGTIFA
jgi:hypothetical protein